MTGACAAEEQPDTTLLLACLAPADRAAMEEALVGDFRLLFAESDQEALGMVEAEAPAAVLCNAASPGTEAFLGRLSGGKAPQSPLVFALVPEGDEDAQVAALEQGADDIVPLPVRRRLVRARLKSALRNKCATEARSQEINDQLRFLNETARFLLVGANPDAAIHRALQKIREHFDGERSYLFELDDEREESRNTYEECAPGVPSEQENLQHLPYSVQGYILEEFRNDRIVRIEDVAAMPERGRAERRVLDRQGVRSAFLVPLWSEGRLIGYVGVDDPRKNMRHVAQLAAIGDYLAAMLARRDQTLQMGKDRELAQKLMNDTPGGFVRMKMSPGGEASPVFVNDGFCDMMGMGREEVMALYTESAYAGVHPDDVPALRRAATRAMEDDSIFSARARFLHKEKGYLLFQAFYRTTTDPDGTQYTNGYYADITPEAEREERRRELLDNLPCGAIIFEIAPDGTIDCPHINRRYIELVGRDATELRVHNATRAVHPDDRERLMDAIDEAIREDRLMECDILTLKGDGSYLPFHLVGRVVEKSPLKTVMYTTYTPISEETRSLGVALEEQRRAEQQARETNDQLRFLNDASRYLLAGSDPDDSIRLALDKTREYFGGDRSYVFELDDEKGLTSNTYEVCALGAAPQQENLQNLPYAAYRHLMGILERGESVCIESAEAILASGIDDDHVITNQGIESIILVPLRAGEQLVGFMGVDNPTRNTSHASHLAALGDYVTAILHRRDDEEQILRDNRVMRDLMNDMPGGFVQQLVTPDGRTVPQFINDEFCRMSGMSHDECVRFYNTDGFTGVHPDDCEMAKEALEELIANRDTLTLRLRLIRGDGSYVPMQVFYRVTDDRDGNLLLSGYYTDLTEQLALEERELAEHDQLTDLYNRTRLVRMRDGDYLGLSSCGVLFFDVNHLKLTNDTQGHERGDAMLRLVADGIHAIEDDRVHGYRYGGDEFIVVVCGGEEDELPALVERWKEAMRGLSTDREVVATAAVGSAWSRAPFTLGDLIRRADQAMYDEKQRGRGQAR